jgi:hypothetical protein
LPGRIFIPWKREGSPYEIPISNYGDSVGVGSSGRISVGSGVGVLVAVGSGVGVRVGSGVEVGQGVAVGGISQVSVVWH